MHGIVTGNGLSCELELLPLGEDLPTKRIWVGVLEY